MRNLFKKLTRALQALVPSPLFPRAMTPETLAQENIDYAGTTGISENNTHLKFLPAFRDESTGRIELARYANGHPAPLHLLGALPKEWATEVNPDGEVCAVRESIVAGFVRGDRFYTRAEAAAQSSAA